MKDRKTNRKGAFSMKKCLSVLALILLLVCLLPMQVCAAETMPIEDFKAAVAEAVASGNDLVLDKTVLIQEDMDLNMGSSKLIFTNGAQFAVTHGFTLRFTGFLWIRNGELNVNPTATLDVTPGSKVIIGSEGLVLDGIRYESIGKPNFNMVGTLCCGGSLDILPDGTMWIPDGANASIDNHLTNLGAVHVIGSNAVLDLYGTADISGYLCIHPSCKFQVHDGSTLNIFNDESGCGYLENYGFVLMGKNTVKLDGLFTTAKSEESTTDIDGAVQLWGTTITASEKSTLGIGSKGDLAMNDATITSTGEIGVRKEAALWVHSNSTLSAEGKLIGEGNIHVGLAGEGVLDLYGTTDISGYLCIHPAGKLQVHDDSTLNILNNETGCGYLDNYGFVHMGKSTVKLDGLFTIAKSEESTTDIDGAVQLWGTTITASDKSLLGVGSKGDLAMNDATVTSAGEINVGKEGALWVHNNSALTANGNLSNLGAVHVGFDGKGTLTLGGTATTNGYLAVHPDGTLNLTKKATLHILNTEDGCGYLENHGIVKLNGTLTVDGLFSSEIAEPVITATNKAANGKPQLTWKAVNNATKYEIYRSTTKNGTYKKLYTQKGTTYTNTSAEAGKLYYYKIKAIDGYGNSSGFSNRVNRTCDLAKPTNVKTANVAASGKIKLTWTKVTGAKSYKIYRATAQNGKYTLVKTVTGTTYTDTNAKAGTKYFYKVMAVHENTNANSAYSAIVSRVADLAKPTASIKRSDSGKPRISWKKVEGAVKYEIYRSTSKNGTYSKIATTKNLYQVNKNAKAGVTYYYKVKAVHSNTNANSAFSNIVTIKSK